MPKRLLTWEIAMTADHRWVALTVLGGAAGRRSHASASADW